MYLVVTVHRTHEVSLAAKKPKPGIVILLTISFVLLHSSPSML